MAAPDRPMTGQDRLGRAAMDIPSRILARIMPILVAGEKSGDGWPAQIRLTYPNGAKVSVTIPPISSSPSCDDEWHPSGPQRQIFEALRGGKKASLKSLAAKIGRWFYDRSNGRGGYQELIQLGFLEKQGAQLALTEPGEDAADDYAEADEGSP